jgi:hypothetical protein
LRPPPWPEVADANLLEVALTAWASACPRPLVLFFDEIDALRGASLDGYLERLGLDTGVLVVFDRRPGAAPIAERTAFEEARTPSGRAATVLRA